MEFFLFQNGASVMVSNHALLWILEFSQEKNEAIEKFQWSSHEIGNPRALGGLGMPIA